MSSRKVKTSLKKENSKKPAKPVKKVSSNGPKKVIKKSVKKEIKKENPKTELSKENKAAIIIQKNVRRYLSRKKFIILKRNQKEYEKKLAEIQKKAFAMMVKAEQEAAEKERIEYEEKRKAERLVLKQKKRVLEAAFDGDIASIQAVLNEVKDLDDQKKVANDQMGQITRRLHLLEFVECCDANDNSALSEASSGGSCEAIEFLIQQGADVNSKGAFGRTPLYRAAFAGHLSAVETLLQYGADPRIYADDSNTPAQIGSLPQIVETLENWDISITERLLTKLESEKSRRLNDAQKQKDVQASKLKDDLSSAEKEYERLEKIYQRTCKELQKRIKEHDLMVEEGNKDMAAVTLKTVHQAENDLESAKISAEKAKKVLDNIRLDIREKKQDISDLKMLECNLKELEDVLIKDVGERIKSSGRWPLLIDPAGQSAMFLRYRNTNYLCAINPTEAKPEKIRLALLGGIRFGKPFVLDMMEADMFDIISDIMDQIQPNLMKSLMSKEIVKEENYMKLVKPSDDSQYQSSQFMHQFADQFQFVIITKKENPPQSLLDKTYPIKIKS